MAFVCLIYHDVFRRVPAAGAPPSSTLYHVEEDAFARQLAVIESAGRPVVGLQEAVAAPARPAVTLTFDDGWRGTFERALPLLHERGWAATVFVTRDFVGRPGFCTEAMIVAAAAAGFEIGVHGCTHRMLAACSSPEVVAELAACRAYLEDLLSRPVELASLPGGSGDGRVAACAARAGMRVLCTSRPGLNDPTTSPLALRRVAIRRDTPDRALLRYCGQRLGRESLAWAVRRAPRELLGERRYAAIRRHVLDRRGDGPELFSP